MLTHLKLYSMILKTLKMKCYDRDKVVDKMLSESYRLVRDNTFSINELTLEQSAERFLRRDRVSHRYIRERIRNFADTIEWVFLYQ